MLIPVCTQRDTPLTRMDPRIRVVSVFAFVALVSSLTSRPLLISAVGLITALALWSGMGPGHLLRRIALVLPFAGVVLMVFPFAVPGEAVFGIHLGLFDLSATEQGISRAAILSLRVLAAVMAVNMLTATTSFSDLTRALRGLKVPAVFVQVLEFTVRYIFVLADEVQRMRVARKSRCFRAGRSLFAWSTFRALGQLVGVLFIRSWDRGERIYCAMLARGYSAE